MLPPSIQHNARIDGPDDGSVLVFAHGYGCDQNMWRMVAPAFGADHRVVLFDLAGCGGAAATFDPSRHTNLVAHAEDVCGLIRDLGCGPVTFIGHSVSAMIGALAGIRAPELFEAMVMIGPSPCYFTDGDYPGGFAPEDIESLLDLLDGNHHAWAAQMAPVIMGNADRPELSAELETSFCRMEPSAARAFARASFTADCRADLPLLDMPTLILQSRDDALAKIEVGQWVARHIQQSSFVQLDATGHCPHISAPDETIRALRAWLD